MHNTISCIAVAKAAAQLRRVQRGATRVKLEQQVCTSNSCINTRYPATFAKETGLEKWSRLPGTTWAQTGELESNAIRCTAASKRCKFENSNSIGITSRF